MGHNPVLKLLPILGFLCVISDGLSKISNKTLTRDDFWILKIKKP